MTFFLLPSGQLPVIPKVILYLFFIFPGLSLIAQENPPVPVQVKVNTSQFLNFGAFTAGNNGGTVSVDYNGTRSWTDDIVLMNLGESPSPALFDVTANPGTIIHINAPTQIKLQGTGGSGGTIYLDINSFSTGNPFIVPLSANSPNMVPVYVGGTLRIPNSSTAPPGKYIGNFTLTFIHQ